MPAWYGCLSYELALKIHFDLGFNCRPPAQIRNYFNHDLDMGVSFIKVKKDAVLCHNVSAYLFILRLNSSLRANVWLFTNPCNLVCRYLLISRDIWLTHSLLLYASCVYISASADSFMFSFFFPPFSLFFFPILCTFTLIATINSFRKG